MSKSEKTGWTVVGASYVTELMKNNRQAQMLYLLAAAGILIGVILISSFISSEITKPLRRLRRFDESGGKGDLNRPVWKSRQKMRLEVLANRSMAMNAKDPMTLMEQNIL